MRQPSDAEDEHHPLIPSEGMNTAGQLFGGQTLPVGKGMGQATAMLGWTTWSWGMAAVPAAVGAWSAPISVMNE
jgi:hypothetical protein